MIFGLLLAFWAMFFGLTLGAIQGYFGGWIDIAGQRLTEIWSALPFLYVMIFIGAALGRSFLILLVCYSLFNPGSASPTTCAPSSCAFATVPLWRRHVAKAFSVRRIIFIHILPNALTPLITLFPFTLIRCDRLAGGSGLLGFRPAAAYAELGASRSSRRSSSAGRGG